MNAAVVNPKGRWVAAGVGATLIVVVFFALSRISLPVPNREATPPAAAAKPVSLARAEAANPLLAEETAMRDLTPLFLPTERNVSLKRPTLREPGESSLEAPPIKLSFADTAPGFRKDLPPIAVLNGKPAAEAGPLDALPTDEAAQGVLGLGRKDPRITPLPARGGVVEIVAMATGQVVLVEPLPVEARPATDQPWQPLELLATIDAAGLVAPPVITNGSRVEQVDQHYRNYLVRTFGIGERLAPGFYRIIVGQ